MLHMAVWGHALECCLHCSFGACTDSVFEVGSLICFRNVTKRWKCKQAVNLGWAHITTSTGPKIARVSRAKLEV